MNQEHVEDKEAGILFARYKFWSLECGELAGVIQNGSSHISPENVEDWREQLSTVRNTLYDLEKDTEAYLRENVADYKSPFTYNDWIRLFKGRYGS